MTDVKDIQEKKGNPIDNAVNKIRENMSKDNQKKIDEQVKVALDAKKIYETAKSVLRDLIKEQEVDKVEINEFLKSLK